MTLRLAAIAILIAGVCGWTTFSNVRPETAVFGTASLSVTFHRPRSDEK